MTSPSLQERFARQAALTPDETAVVLASGELTYRELDERANRLAHRLLDLGVRPEEPVAVLMERSAELVVAILAVVKAGACYLPLHSAYPPERIQRIVDLGGGTVLLTDHAMRGRGLPAVEHTVVVDTDAATSRAPAHDPGRPGHPLALAYLMFTSGSTGEPKGVAVTHRDALALALDSCWDGGAHERVLMVAPYAFGMSTYELWVPLLRGGRLVLAPEGQPTAPVLRKAVEAHGITVVHLTAGLFRVIAEEDPGALSGLREVMTGGDRIPPAAVGRVLAANPGLVVRAMYGSTETTLFATQSEMRDGYEPGDSVPVGRPLDGMRAHVLDERLRPVPSGETGELYMAGAGVARGYLARPALTAERFVPDPFGPAGTRMYRTGDLVRHTPEGLIDFIGRSDSQVKIRGFRVEPGEAEAVLARHPDVAQIAVVAEEAARTGERRLAAYAVLRPSARSEDPAGTVDSLRAHARRSLPDFLVPSRFTVLDALPLTVNGKLDRRALTAPAAAEDGSAGAAAPAVRSGLEVLRTLYADVLGVESVGPDDDFFELGGNSLLAIRLISRVQAELGAELAVPVVFDESTPAALAAHLDREASPAGAPSASTSP
ncbi:hypothetical protein GCM10010387_49010 [Streptomyces inusitatus]|uniref:Carrier domain-containing protein n=1 Tax=Streptomyces inusitatus TaxID=68221 RepID=A0A918QJF3_9ACTN|nr:non-ribosomal peptide synthetase [Streptomyces inusitatus]GGZ48819.1 hypothetical protein GCM10010387_49010 [Streptomyces inusitatus]